jgi:ATP-dependent Clp protease protease subunit
MKKVEEKKGADFEEDINEFVEDVLINALTASEDSSIQDIYDVFSFKNRSILLKDIKSNSTGSNIYQDILLWNIIDKNKSEKKREPIKIYIDSWGGSLIDGFEIIDAIKASKTPVYTIVTGAAYSCGLMIAMAGHKRFAYPRSSFLMHEGSIGSEIQDAHKFKKYAEFYNVQLDQMKQFIIEHSKITDEEYDKLSKDDNWFTADQALEKGFIDEITKELI